MIYTIKKMFIFMVVSLALFIEVSHASPANELRAVIVAPFHFIEDAAPQNVLDEMNIDNDLPQIIFDYFQKVNAFKNISLGEENTQVEADIYIKGEILHVSGGNGAARWWGGIAGAGRSGLVVGVKVYDKDGQLLNEGVARQAGARGGSVFSVFSNKKNITTAMKAIPQKVFIAVLAGDLTTKEGVVRAMESNDPIVIQAGAKSSNTNKLFVDESVTDSMVEVLLKTLEGDIQNKYYIDGAAWCAINLGNSSNKKYIATLEKVVSSKADKKIIKHAKNALKLLNDQKS